MRPIAICKLLDSVAIQQTKPDEIIVVDGSTDTATQQAMEQKKYDLPIRYYQVSDEHRGLTRQRNYGIARVSTNIEIVAFLDDDLVLEPDYFIQIIKTYTKFPDAIGVGGIDLKENHWQLKESNKSYPESRYYELDGWVYPEPRRYRLRKRLGLLSSLPPGKIPPFSHGRSSFPPNGCTYEVDHFMGGIASYRKEIFDKIEFSRFFEGYGLYEDFDFTVRASRLGKLYVNTNARVWHYHEPSGRPDQYEYGKMVVRNGWYVWRLKYPHPAFEDRIKWNLITILLTFSLLRNVFDKSIRTKALTEFLGRLYGCFTLLLEKPKINLNQ